MTLQLYMWVSWISTLHYIDYNSVAHRSDVAEMTHDMARHDKDGMFMLLVVCMPSYSATEWWMCSWCIIASSSHDKVFEVFDGLGVRLMLCVHVAPLLVLWHASCVRSFTKKSPCMHSLFVRSQNNLFACIPCSLVREIISSHALLVHPICYRIMSHPCTCICNHSWQDNIKSNNLLVYHDALSFTFGCRWPRERTRLWNCARKISSRDAGSGHYRENCAEVIGRLRWTIRINSDCSWDLARLESRSTQFF